MRQRYFITGTDTAVGKTLLTVALIRAAQNAGHTAIGCKPVAAGCELPEDKWVNDDALAIKAANSLDLSYEQINPVALQEFIAPHIAAANEGIDISVDELAKHIDALPDVDYTFIEGAGGWLVPLNKTETMADVAVALNIPVILVTGLRLGCINHTLLTVAAIKQAGLRLAGWIGNCVDADMPVREANINTLRESIDAPLLGIVPWMGTPDAEAAASELQITSLASD